MLRLLYIGQLIGACRSVKNYAFLSGKNVFFIPSLGSKHFYGRIGSTILFLRLNEIKNITKQKHTTMWHKLLAGALLLFLTSNSTAQQMTYKQWLALTVPPIGNTNRQIDCSPTTISVTMFLVLLHTILPTRAMFKILLDFNWLPIGIHLTAAQIFMMV
jgi:hypothetical protein